MDLTRDTALSAFVLISLGSGSFLIVRALLELRSASPWWSRSGPLALSGVTLIVALVLGRGSETADVLRLRVQDADGLTAVIITVLSLAVGVGVGDYVFVRLVPIATSWIQRAVSRFAGPKVAPIVSSGMVLGSGAVIALSALVGLEVIDPVVEARVGPSSDVEVELMAEYQLPDEPKDLVFRDERSGYLSSASSIHFFELPTQADGELRLRTVTAPGELTNPRGLGLASGFLFVAEQGERRPDAPRGLYSIEGSVIRFTVGADGDLSERTEIIQGVPIANELHGINGIAEGPDGMLYLSVGSIKERIGADVPNVEWLGTILRFDEAGRNLDVYARGLRNVYDLEFDEQGSLWGVDNDGPTLRDYRAEEVLQIKEDHHYGYPFEGTYGRFAVRTDGPVWALSGYDFEGTAGIELSENLGLRPGLFIGARVLSLFRFDRDEDGPFAWGKSDVQAPQVVFARQGYFTIVEAGDDGLLYVGVNGLSLDSHLYVLKVTDR